MPLVYTMCDHVGLVYQNVVMQGPLKVTVVGVVGQKVSRSFAHELCVVLGRGMCLGEGCLLGTGMSIEIQCQRQAHALGCAWERDV
jgi:hypothetical protein